MTTIQNYRDTTLQATSPRVVQTGSDYIRLVGPSTQFKVQTSGIATPTSITITGSLVGNLQGDIVFSVDSGTAVITQSNNTCTVTYDNMSSDSITILGSLVYGGNTFQARYTIAKVYDGSDPVLLDLAYDADIVTTDSTGGTYTLPTGNVLKLYKGSLLLTSGVSYSGTATKNGLTASINSSTGAITLSGTNWTTDRETFTFTASYNSKSYSIEYVITKSKAAPPTTIYEIFTSSPVITKDAQDAITVGNYTSITIQGKKYEGTSLTPINYGWVTVTANNETEAGTATDTASTAYTLAPAPTAGKSSYTIKLYNQATVSGATLLDTQIIYVVYKGATGTNGTRTAILDMYQWSLNAPTAFPVGTSQYNWSTGQFSAPATPNSWSLTPPAPVVGQTLWIARTIYADSLATPTTDITWTATTARAAGASGAAGANGQRVGFLEVYQWAATAPTAYPSGTSTYTWATGAFTAPSTPAGWSLTPGAATAGQTLWAIAVSVSDNLTTSTSIANWNSTTVYAVGAAGTNGTNGTSALQAILSNEAHVFPATSTGAIPANGYVGSGTQIRVYEGAVELAYDGTGTTAGTWKITTSTINITAGTISDSGTYATVADHSGVAAAVDTSSIVYTITGKTLANTSFSITKTQTFSKSKTGSDAVIIDLISESDVVPASSTGTTYTLPTTINKIRLYSGGAILSSGVTYGPATQTQGGLTAAVGANGTISLSGTWTTDMAQFTFTATYLSLTYSTVYTITKAKTGTTGATGPTCGLTVNTQSITYDSNGATPSPTSVTFTGTAYNVTTPYYEFIVAGTSKQNTTTRTYTYTVPTSYTSMPQQVVLNVRSASSTGTILATATIALLGTKPGAPGTSVTGATGDSARRCYSKTTLTSLATTPSTISTAGNSTFPPANSWGNGTSWGSTPVALAAGESLYQSDGIYSPVTNTTVWNVPYLSNLKVGSLEAITATLGTMTSGTITAGTINTAASGARVSISSSLNRFSIYSTTGTEVVAMGGGNDLTNKFFTKFSGGSYPNIYFDDSGSLDTLWVRNTYNSGTANITSGAVYGSATSHSGVRGTSIYGNGVRGESSGNSSSVGVAGQSSVGLGVHGHAASSTTYTNHGVRGTNARGTSGIVGCQNGYNFYADGAATLDYGTFTGAHDVLFDPQESIELGDIVVDSECLLKSTMSNVMCVVTKSTIANQKGTIGVIAVIRGYLRNEYPPAAFDMYNNSVVDDFGNTTSPHTTIYEYCCDNYYYHSINALGEGQINVCGENGNLETGDLIVASSIPGKGMRQSDDIIRSYTVAKCREPVVFDYPEQVKMVACIYLCG